MMQFQTKAYKKHFTVLLSTDKETYIFPFKSKPNNASLGLAQKFKIIRMTRSKNMMEKNNQIDLKFWEKKLI